MARCRVRHDRPHPHYCDEAQQPEAPHDVDHLQQPQLAVLARYKRHNDKLRAGEQMLYRISNIPASQGQG